ncbi:hypothetical protein PO909_008959, partial [Leuciscus waleckii]
LQAAVTDSYAAYYDQTEIPGIPCNNGNVKAFSEVFFPTLYSIVFIVGLIGNGLVVWVLIRYRQKSNMTDVCLFNLALSDLLFLLSLPFWAHGAIDEWIFGKFMCHTITGFFMIGLYGSIFFMVLMTLDRYVVIVHAHSLFSRNGSAKMRLILASFVWMLSLFSSLPNIIFAKVKNDSGIKTSCGTDFPEGTAWMSFTYLQMNLLSLIIPLIIMSFPDHPHSAQHKITKKTQSHQTHPGCGDSLFPLLDSIQHCHVSHVPAEERLLAFLQLAY